MEVKLTDRAKEAIEKSGVKNYRIDVVGDGWAGPVFGLVQGEPTKDDIVIKVDDINFAVEDYFQEVINTFEVDYFNGILRKGFIVYPNGQRGGC